jgi:hypothetical protein
MGSGHSILHDQVKPCSASRLLWKSSLTALIKLLFHSNLLVLHGFSWVLQELLA